VTDASVGDEMEQDRQSEVRDRSGRQALRQAGTGQARPRLTRRCHGQSHPMIPIPLFACGLQSGPSIHPPARPAVPRPLPPTPYLFPPHSVFCPTSGRASVSCILRLGHAHSPLPTHATATLQRLRRLLSIISFAISASALSRLLRQLCTHARTTRPPAPRLSSVGDPSSARPQRHSLKHLRRVQSNS
jgi:hypothetical protein